MTRSPPGGFGGGRGPGASFSEGTSRLSPEQVEVVAEEARSRQTQERGQVAGEGQFHRTGLGCPLPSPSQDKGPSGHRSPGRQTLARSVGTNSTSLTWEPVRNAGSQAPLTS